MNQKLQTQFGPARWSAIVKQAKEQGKNLDTIVATAETEGNAAHPDNATLATNLAAIRLLQGIGSTPGVADVQTYNTGLAAALKEAQAQVAAAQQAAKAAKLAADEMAAAQSAAAAVAKAEASQ